MCWWMTRHPSSGQGCRIFSGNAVEEALGFHLSCKAALQAATYISSELGSSSPGSVSTRKKRHISRSAYGVSPKTHTSSSLENFLSLMWHIYLTNSLDCSFKYLSSLSGTPGKLFTPVIPLGKDLHRSITQSGGNTSFCLFSAWLLLSLHGASPLPHPAQIWLSTAWGGRFPTYESSTTLPRAFLDALHSC